MANPIIKTLLDTDLYKFTMQQSMVHRYPDASARMEFHCRDDQPLQVSAKALREQCDMLGELRLSGQELDWLAALPFMSDAFIDYLSRFRLNPGLVSIEEVDGRLSVSVEGNWSAITHFEIFLLAIISELHCQSFGISAEAKGQKRLEAKLGILSDDPSFHLVDFGTRRRYSRQWHEYVVGTLKRRLPNSFSGTSNLHLARTMELRPIGTMAHEWLQSHQVLGHSLLSSQKDALGVWLEEYGDQLGIALTDTINMQAFLRDFDFTLANAYQGIRHDSGDPFAWGEQALAHYRSLGVDPSRKQFVFSDKLDFETALAIHRHFSTQVNVSFGIGTYLTNDMGHKAPNIVLKLTELNGAPVAKLSDSPGKTLCRDPAFVKLLKTTFSCL